MLALYNRARKVKTDAQQGTDRGRELSGIVVAELVMYIEEAHLETSTAPVFKPADLAHLYMSRMEQLGVVSDTRVNTTRLKQRLLAHFPDLRAHTKGRDVFLVFDENIGAALGKACEQDSDSDAVHVLHRLYVDTCLKIQNPSIGHLKKCVRRSPCQTYCLH